MSSTQEVGEIFGAGSGPAHAMLRSPTVLIAAVGLWGMNIYFFRVFGIDYVKVLNHDLLKIAAAEEREEHQEVISESGSTTGSHNKQRQRSKRDISKKDSSGGSERAITSEKEEVIELLEDVELSIMENPDRENFVDEITAGRLICLSLTLLIMLHSTYSIWIDWLGGGLLGGVFAFYGAVTTAILFPLNSNRWLRQCAGLVLHRAFELVNPRCHCCIMSGCGGDGTVTKTPRPIPFVDVFFADAMCSFSKVFFDWGMLLHMAAYYPKPVPQSAYNILIPSAFAAVPYLIRARQCLVMWTVTSLKNDPGRYQHLWNALKYSTSIFPLVLSAYQKTIAKDRAADLEVYLILLLFINASYSFFWDVVMDWGMMKNPTVAATVICKPGPNLAVANGLSNNTPYVGVPQREHKIHHPSPIKRTASANGASFSCWYALLRNRLRFGVSMSVLILVTDAVLRFSWTLRFYHALFPSGDSFVLCTQFLEVFRRAIWNLLRVEWENLKQSGQHHLQPKPTSHIVEMSSMLPADEDKASFLVQRGGGSISKLPYVTKITNEKNAKA